MPPVNQAENPDVKRQRQQPEYQRGSPGTAALGLIFLHIHLAG